MAYNQKNNPFKKLSSSPVTVRESPFFVKKSDDPYKDIDFDNLTDTQKKEMNLLPDVNIDRYGFDVTRYKSVLENPDATMLPGHIQASLSNPGSKKVQEDLDVKNQTRNNLNTKGTRINPWYNGNRFIDSKTKLSKGENYKDRKAYETQRVYLKKDEAKNFLKVAKTIKPTKDPYTFSILGEQYKLPFGSEGYNFIKNNCADGTCEGFGIDSDDAKMRLNSGGMILDTLVNQVMTDGGITEPKKAWDLIMDKFGVKKK